MPTWKLRLKAKARLAKLSPSSLRKAKLSKDAVPPALTGDNALPSISPFSSSSLDQDWPPVDGPALPVELVLFIFELAYPPSEAPLFRPLPRSHVDAYLTFSLVSRTWYQWAQPKLYHYPHLHLLPTMALFVRTVKRNPALAARVRHLELDGRKHGARLKVTGKLKSVWKVCKAVQSVIVKDADDVSLEHFVGSKSLRTLSIVEAQLVPTSSSVSLVFPALLHLSLTSVIFDDSSHVPLLSSRTFPLLTHFSLTDSLLGHDGMHGYRVKSLSSKNDDLFPQLVVLGLGLSPKDAQGSSEVDLKRCTKLKAVNIGPWGGARRVLGTLKTPLEVLKVESGFTASATRMKELRDDVVGLIELESVALGQLKRLVVPPSWEDDERVRSLCAAKKIEFEVEPEEENALFRAAFWGLGEVQLDVEP